MSIVDILTLAAIVIGPISAVVITRIMDSRSAAYSRKYHIFGDLIRTRAAKISPEHVSALNLVEIEFNRSSRVKPAWDRYMENLSADMPAEQAAFNNFLIRRDQLFIKLVQEIANDIGYKNVDITDMMTTNYYPRGWQNAEDEQRQLRQLLIGVLSGTKPIPVRIQDSSQWNGPFPPFVPQPNQVLNPAPLVRSPDIKSSPAISPQTAKQRAG